MSKFNSTKVSGPTEVNFMGEKAYALSDKEKLTVLTMTTFLSDSYYMRQTDVVKNILNLVDTVGYEFAAKLAIYARTVGNMRSVSHLIASRVCRNETHPEWMKSFYNSIVVRPDDISEILCCYAHLNGIDLTKSFKKIPNSMKKGFRKALERLSPYQIDKYKMSSKTLSLVDLVNLLHPHPTAKNAEAYRLLMHGESLSGTYDAKIFEKEMTAAGQNADGCDVNVLKHDAIVSVLKGGMPIMNLLRNLKNIALYAPDQIDIAIEQLTNEDKILHSKLLPFRFTSAYDAVNKLSLTDYTQSDVTDDIVFESEYTSMTDSKLDKIKTKLLKALEMAMTISCKNVPDLDGNCAILIDHSGSVRGYGYGSSKVSPWSMVNTAMIGNLFGAITAFKQKNVYVGMFGDELIPVKMDRDMGILEFNKKSYDDGYMCGGATENGLYTFLKSVISQKKNIDNFIIFSDMEIGDGGSGGWDRTSRSDTSFKKLFSEFRKINPHCLTVCCNICGRSGTSVFNPNLNLLNISGWSNSIFDLISMYKSGKIKSMTEEIEKIVL